MQERDLLPCSEAAGLPSHRDGEVPGFRDVHATADRLRPAFGCFDGSESVASPDLLAGYDTLLIEWACDFVASELLREHEVTDTGAARTLARLLQAGADAAVWRVDDANLTAVFLICGIRRVVAVSPGGWKGSVAALSSSILKLCKRVLGPADAS